MHQQPSVLLISSSRGLGDPHGALRLQETVSVLLQLGWSVDVLVPRHDPNVTLDRNARLFTVPRLPFTSHLPDRPSCRRFLVAAFMFLHGAFLVSHGSGYTLVHGMDDGAIVARAIDRATIRRFPYVADFASPFSRRGAFHGIRAIFARRHERTAIRHAAAVILQDASLRDAFDRPLPRARLSIIPDPNGETSHAAFSFSDFSAAVAQLYAYASGR